MATWTTLPDASLEPGKPIRSIDGLALRDNPVAITEGAAGAPRIIGRAAKRINDYAVLTVSASDAERVELGSNLEILTLFTTSTANPPTVVAIRYTISTYTGSIRFKASHRINSDLGWTSRLSIFKNGTLIQAYTTTSDSLVVRTNDVSIAPGDIIEWRHSSNNAGINSIVSGNPTATASDGYIERPLYIANSEVNRA
jgi:hypothetical protein